MATSPWTSRAPPQPLASLAPKRARAQGPRILKFGRLPSLPVITCPNCTTEQEFDLSEEALGGENQGNMIYCKLRGCNQILTVPGFCRCGLPLETRVSQSIKNPGRAFLACPIDRPRCFFRWQNETLSEADEEAAINLEDPVAANQ
jgi:GRF zinc finger